LKQAANLLFREARYNGGIVKMASSFKIRKKVVLMILLLTTAAIAGVHAYTNNLVVHHSLYDAIYWSEIGSSYPSVRMGE
jgi:hypothetical protein